RYRIERADRAEVVVERPERQHLGHGRGTLAGLAARAEVGRVGGAVREAGARRAASDADPDLAEPAAEDVVAVRRAVHPDADDAGRRAVGTGSPGDVLADEPAAGSAQVAGCADAPDEVAVGEVGVAHHVLRVAA